MYDTFYACTKLTLTFRFLTQIITLLIKGLSISLYIILLTLIQIFSSRYIDTFPNVKGVRFYRPNLDSDTAWLAVRGTVKYKPITTSYKGTSQ